MSGRGGRGSRQLDEHKLRLRACLTASSTELFLSNIPVSTTEEMLRQYFSDVGQITELNIVQLKVSSLNRFIVD